MHFLNSYIFWGFVGLFLMVVAHEFGHALMAARNGIAIKSFNIGLPMAVIDYRRPEERKRLSWLPVTVKAWIPRFKVKNLPLGFSPILLGAFVSIDNQSFQKASPRAKIASMLGGVLANWLLWVIFVSSGFYAGLDLSRIDWTPRYIPALLATAVVPLVVGLVGLGLMFVAWFPPLSIPLIIYLFSAKNPLSEAPAAIYGPVSLFEALTKMFSESISLEKLLLTLSTLSLALAVTNSLFVPGLDGGHVWMVLLKRKFGLSQNWERMQRIATIIGFGLILGIIMVGVVDDIVNRSLPMLLLLFGPTLAYHSNKLRSKLVYDRRDQRRTIGVFA